MSESHELIHGTCVAFGPYGALLRGASGSGKSDLALRFIALPPEGGYAPMLVADSLQLATRKPPEDMRAYDYYLKSKALVETASTAADLTAADELLVLDQ